MKILFILFAFLVSTNMVAQNYSVQYYVTTAENTMKAELIINDTISTFTVLPQLETNPGEDRFFIKNTQAYKAYFSQKLMNLIFYVTDSIHNMKWELSNDTATILNEICLSAKTNFRGRNYTAYYSTKYSLSDGPWKFGGLPGLVLAIKSDDNYIEWKAFEIIDNSNKKTNTVNIQKYNFIKWDEFVLKYKSAIAKYIKLVRSNGNLESGATAYLKINGAEIFYPEVQTGEGIKF